MDVGNNEVIPCFSPLTTNDTVNSVVNVAETTDVDNVISDVTISSVSSASLRNGRGRRHKQRTTLHVTGSNNPRLL